MIGKPPFTGTVQTIGPNVEVREIYGFEFIETKSSPDASLDDIAAALAKHGLTIRRK
jgi:hypothetical protein